MLDTKILYLQIFKTPLILTFIYTLFHQEQIFDIFRKMLNFLPFARVSDNGKISTLGLIVYGAIFALIFTLVKNIIDKKQQSE